MRAFHLLSLLALLSLMGHLAGADDAPATDPTKVYLVVQGGAFGAGQPDALIEDLTQPRQTAPERLPFGGFTAITSNDPKTVFADATKAGAGQVLHVSMLTQGKDPRTKRPTLTALYTLYEFKKSAAKPQPSWQKVASQKLGVVGPTDAVTAVGLQLPETEHKLMAIELRAVLVSRIVSYKVSEGKAADKNSMTVTVMAANTSKLPIAALTLALPVDDGVARYAITREELLPGDKKKLTFVVKGGEANKLAWKNARLTEVYFKRNDDDKAKQDKP